MLTLNQISLLLKDRKLSVVSERTGLSQDTLRGLRDSTAKAPLHSTIKVISDYLTDNATD
jgi:hypothetical protein